MLASRKFQNNRVKTMTNKKEHQQTEGKKTKGRKGRMYVQQRNISLVGLRDLPDHMKGGDSPAQLTPIYSILLSDIEAAFLAQLKGETNSYINMLTLKPKFTSSKLEVRKTTAADDFGWIDDIELLKQLPTEFAALEKELEKRFNKFKEIAVQRSLEQIEKDAALLSVLGLTHKVPATTEENMDVQALKNLGMIKSVPESTKKLVSEAKEKLGI